MLALTFDSIGTTVSSASAIIEPSLCAASRFRATGFATLKAILSISRETA